MAESTSHASEDVQGLRAGGLIHFASATAGYTSYVLGIDRQFLLTHGIAAANSVHLLLPMNGSRPTNTTAYGRMFLGTYNDAASFKVLDPCQLGDVHHFRLEPTSFAQSTNAQIC